MTWRPTTWGRATVTLGVAAAVVGVVTGRPDAVAVAAPLLLHAAHALLTRPRGPAVVTVRSADQEPGHLLGTAVIEAPPGAEAAHVRVSCPGAGTAREAVVAVRGRRELGLAVRTVRTGVHELFRVDAAVLGAGHAAPPTTAGPVRVLVLPRSGAVGAVPLPPRLGGLAGAHDSRRAGHGGDLHDIHPLTPGDRLRRIDWRTTVRRAAGAPLTDLYVRRTHATAEATVMLVLDSRDDVSGDVATWSGGGDVAPTEPTSLDLAREAAATVARRYLDQGDRVGLEDLGRRRRPLRPATGRHHLERVLRRLALAAPEPSLGPRRRAPQIPADSLVVVLSTFLDGEAAGLAARWHRTGHRVIAVDVLPEPSEDRLRPRVRTAFRLVRLERQNRLAALERAGVELVTWAGGSGESALAALARRPPRLPGRAAHR